MPSEELGGSARRVLQSVDDGARVESQRELGRDARGVLWRGVVGREHHEVWTGAPRVPLACPRNACTKKQLLNVQREFQNVLIEVAESQKYV